MKQDRELSASQFFSQLILLVALIVVTFPRVFFHGELLSSSDLLYMVKPWSEHKPADFGEVQNELMFDPVMAFRPDYLLTQNALKNGEWPLWNPLELGGVPLLANCQSTVFYPLRLLLLVTDVDTAMTAFVLIKLLLCGITAFVCARWLRLSLAASRFFSVAWMMGSYNLIWANWPLVDVSAWIPILFAGAELVLQGRYKRGFAAMALGATLILYAGHPETAFTFSLGAGVYFLVRLVLDAPATTPGTSRSLAQLTIHPLIRVASCRRTWKKASVAMAAWAIALLAYTPQLLPFVEFLTNSYTWSDRHEKEHVLISYRAGAAASMFVPRFYGTDAEQNFWDKEKWNSNIMAKQYPGMLIWCAIAMLAIRLPKNSPLRARNPQIVALLIAAGVSLLLAYHVWPLSLTRKLPVFSSMLDIYHICFAIFAMPLLGAIALERWLSIPRRVKSLLPIAVLITIACATLYGVYLFNRNLLAMLMRKEMPELGAYIWLQVYIAAAFMALAVLLFIVSCFAKRPNLIWVLAGMLFIADHWVATRGLNPTMPPEQVYPETELTRFLASVPHPARMSVVQGGLYNGAIGNYNIEEWTGYDGLFPERVTRYQSELKYTVWKAMEPAQAIAYYVNDPDPRFEPAFPWKQMLESGRLEWVGRFDTLDVFRNLGALPRAYLVPQLQIIPDRDELIKSMAVPGFDPARLAVTEVTPQSPLPNSNETEVGDATITRYNATNVHVECNADAPAVLVLADAFYPGWNAYLNGQPAEMFPVFYMFRGIIVPEGHHEVEYRYEPLTLRAGLVISTAALLISIALSLAMCRRGRKAAAK